MRTWSVTELGDPNQALKLVDKSVPKVGSNQVLIEVEGAALNFFDILLCQGKYQERPELPFTPGAEVAGAIREVGEGSSFQTGQRVLAMPQLPSGGLAESVVVGEEYIYPIPDSMSSEEAAALFITYQTAYYALHQRGNLQAGEVLLVHAGAGGVGSAAIQLGKAAGARVIASAGGPEKVQICKELGADVVVDYLKDDFVSVVKAETNRRGANVIFDPVGGDVFDRSRKCIAFEGRLLVIGFAGGRIPEAPANHALVKNYSVVGVHWGLFQRLQPEVARDNHQRIIELYQSGAVRPMIYKVFTFEEVIDALNQLADRKTWGKLVVKP